MPPVFEAAGFPGDPLELRVGAVITDPAVLVFDQGSDEVLFVLRCDGHEVGAARFARVALVGPPVGSRVEDEVAVAVVGPELRAGFIAVGGSAPRAPGAGVASRAAGGAGPSVSGLTRGPS